MIVGRSRAVSDLLAAVERIGRSDASVLLLGESGTGKELFARAIHACSPRARGPFLAVNCGAVAAAVAESELFGHVRGAFTGAIADRPGLFAAAHRGTLLLDEIGELALDVQPKLLRALEQREVTPVGAVTPLRVDVRILAATHRPLARDVRAERFRHDLYYRLNVLTLEIPPLRERREDIAPLVGHFATRIAARLGRPTPIFSAAMMVELERHDWPGNVRELANVVERAVVLGDFTGLLDEAPPSRMAEYPFGACTLAELERMHIERIVYECRGNLSRAARVLGINRTTLWKKRRRYGGAGNMSTTSVPPRATVSWLK